MITRCWLRNVSICEFRNNRDDLIARKHVVDYLPWYMQIVSLIGIDSPVEAEDEVAQVIDAL